MPMHMSIDSAMQCPGKLPVPSAALSSCFQRMHRDSIIWDTAQNIVGPFLRRYTMRQDRNSYKMTIDERTCSDSPSDDCRHFQLAPASDVPDSTRDPTPSSAHL